MNRPLAAVLVASALVAAVLTPVAQAAPPPAPTPDIAVAPAASGADCEWGTEPAGVIPHVDYARGYLNGGDWRRDYNPPYECAIGPAWTPIMHNYPYSHVQVTSEELGVQWADQRQCSGLNDPECAPGEWAEMYAESALGF